MAFKNWDKELSEENLREQKQQGKMARKAGDLKRIFPLILEIKYTKQKLCRVRQD
ncbi:MAG: hypothetical protein QQW96_03130 [Tychonema bourrellyi B0820]|uniref:hypothetical protein n=1 Tax=Tychonema bourrellyi TaxID=54313 RepID=UPI0015D4D1A0|nr:hypothetical protein [Tychonema bourrellyi]MDQ2096624.1 hypothetical protein [Tychonema bourrellyi B0820]